MQQQKSKRKNPRRKMNKKNKNGIMPVGKFIKKNKCFYEL
jgi:hypothetical protein